MTNRRRGPRWGAGAAAFFLMGVVIGCSAPTPTPTPTPVPTPSPAAFQHDPMSPVVLPADDAPHPSYNSEWWYYNGHLRTEEGAQFSFHYVVFDVRYPGINPVNIYHLGITDHRTGRFITAQQSVPNDMQYGTPGFAYESDGWVLRGLEGTDRLIASADGYEFDLHLTQRKPAALHGGTGFLEFTPTANTYYYSRTRMDINGTFSRQGQTHTVTGAAWFDHQWGNFRLPDGGGGWDWFSLQLDDGADLMVFQLRDTQKAVFHTFASLVAQSGSTTNLEGGAVEVTSAGVWTSAASGGTYPMGWRVRLEELGFDLTLAPVIDEAEFDATTTTFSWYWEGPVFITGTHTGMGFVELVGYAPFRLLSR